METIPIKARAPLKVPRNPANVKGVSNVQVGTLVSAAREIFKISDFFT